ncbi:MAG: phospholipid carrier-dependent glycosyltransferase [Herpetosiphonaceae bacterium]|nr:phospholipid carrier-dependent glycosyltransferase [Herpetosiphonaceae bacterium]
MKQRRIFLALLALAILAFALRVWYSRVNGLLPQFSNADDGDYYQRALRFVVTGHYVDDSWLIRPPLHVWFFAACLKLALLLGRPITYGVQIIQYAQAGLGAALVPISYSTVTRLVRNKWAGLLFALFWTIWFPFIDLSTTLFSEPLYLFLFTVHLLLLLRYDDTHRLRDIGAAGLALGLTALTRSPALYALVFAVPWLWHKELRRDHAAGSQQRRFRLGWSGWQRVLRPFAILAMTTLLIVLPWTARNWLTYHRFIPVDTLGPINLWLDLGDASERTPKIEQLRRLSQADRQAYATAQALAILAHDPLRPVRPMWSTFQAVVKAQFIEDFFVKRSAYNRALRPVVPLGLLGDLLWLVWMVSGLVGLLHPATDRPFKWVMSSWLLYSVATVLIFHVEPRYLLTIWLLLAMYGSWTLAQGADIVRMLRPHAIRALLVTGVAGAFLLLFVTYRNYPALLLQGLQREQAFGRGKAAFHSNNYPAAEAAFRMALATDPTYIDTKVALAAVLGAEGRPTDGAALLNAHASQQSELMLGALLRAAGDVDQAAPLLEEGERLVNLDVQQWAQTELRPEPRNVVTLGTNLDLGYIRGFALGEQVNDHSLRWLEGEGDITLPLPAPLAVGSVVVLEVAAPIPLNGPVQVQINDGVRLNIQPQAQWRSFVLPVPLEAAGQTSLRLHLRAPAFTPMKRDPASNDPRSLSVMVHQVAVTQ